MLCLGPRGELLCQHGSIPAEDLCFSGVRSVHLDGGLETAHQDVEALHEMAVCDVADEPPFDALVLILGQAAPHWQKVCANGLFSRNLVTAASCLAASAAKYSTERRLQLLASGLHTHHVAARRRGSKEAVGIRHLWRHGHQGQNCKAASSRPEVPLHRFAKIQSQI